MECSVTAITQRISSMAICPKDCVGASVVSRWLAGIPQTGRRTGLQGPFGSAAEEFSSGKLRGFAAVPGCGMAERLTDDMQSDRRTRVYGHAAGRVRQVTGLKKYIFFLPAFSANRHLQVLHKQAPDRVQYRNDHDADICDDRNPHVGDAQRGQNQTEYFYSQREDNILLYDTQAFP